MNNTDPCDDQNVCTINDTCSNGECTGEGPNCDDGDLCTVDSCNLIDGCTHEAVPATGCRTALKSLLLWKDKDDNAKDKLVWKWIKGQATNQPEYGDPTDSTDYALCIYAGTTAAYVVGVNVPASGTLWSALSDKGYKYKDGAGANDGVQTALVKGSDQPKSKALVKGKGAGLPDPTLGDLPAPITAQLINSTTSVCWESQFDDGDILNNTADMLKAKAQ